MSRHSSYPIALKIKGKLCLVVGGGEVAARKVRDLLESGATVKVVAMDLCDSLRTLETQIELVERPFADGDEQGAFLVFAATNDAKVNRHVADRARLAGALVNLADDPQQCDFFVPAKVRRSLLTIALFTEGSAPAVSKKLRKELEVLYGSEYGLYVDLVADARLQILSRKDLPAKARAELIQSVLDLPLLKYIRGGNLDQARKEIERCIFRS